MRPSTDTLLWEEARGGDPDAFGELYERHARVVHAFCLRRTADPQLAEDLTSTARGTAGGDHPGGRGPGAS